MTKKPTKKFGLAAASVAALIAANAAAPAQAGNLESKDDDCPQGAVADDTKLLDARKSGNESSAIGTLRAVNNAQGLHKSKPRAKKKAAKKKAARKKTAKKAAKKAVRKRPGRLKRAMPKARRKAARRRTARRDPC